MKNKGFTLIELITTLALVSAILVILINIVLVIKDLYLKYDAKTILYINQANLSRELNTKISNVPYRTLDVNNPYTCQNSTCTFNLIDGTSINLEVFNDKIVFGDYIYSFPSGTKLKSYSFTATQINNIDTFLNIKIDIENVLYPNINFGVNVVYFLR